MNRSCRRASLASPIRAAWIVAALLVALAPVLNAQEAVRLFAGDSIRVDGQIIGRVLSIEGRVMNVVSHEAPRCRAGLMHGDPAICDPAPLVRHTMNLDEVSIERRMRKPHFALRTVVGGLVGAAGFGFAGYVIGPEIGFGRVSGCVAGTTINGCSTGETRYTPEELDARQKRSDQMKGALFFGVIGGSATVVVARKLSNGWVRIEPVVVAGPDESWGLSFSVPTGR